jgi:hypothetical protein
MDKIGLGIIAHATSAQSSGGFVELPGGQIGYPYINGPTFHMQAFLGDTALFMTQEVVGLQRPVSGYDLDGAAAPSNRLNLAEDIEKLRINRIQISRSEIPQKTCNFLLYRR